MLCRPMDKQSIIHLHTLLSKVGEELAARKTDVSFDKYEAVDVNPISLHRSKADHQEAIEALLEDLDVDE